MVKRKESLQKIGKGMSANTKQSKMINTFFHNQIIFLNNQGNVRIISKIFKAQKRQV